MNNTLAVFGTAALGLSLSLASADARTVRYQINGQTFTYESTRPEEVAAARKRIDAANAADRAKAAAAAERAGNPLTSMFGSDVQRAARAAQSNLEKTLAEEVPTRPIEPRTVQPRSEPRFVKSAREQRRTAAARSASAEPREEQEGASRLATITDSSVKSVYVDTVSGIRTIFMVDGSVREEPIEPGTASAETTGSTRPRSRATER